MKFIYLAAMKKHRNREVVIIKELLEIFTTFAGIGALTFGGGYAMMPLLQKSVAQKRNWATPEEIMDSYAVAQCLPGIIMVNTSMLLGHKKKGIPGMLAAGLGVVTPSIVVIVIIAAFIGRFLEYEWVRHAFNGVQVAVLMLITDAVIKMYKSGVKSLAGIIIFAATLAALMFIPFVAEFPFLPLAAGAVAGIIISERKRGGSSA
jgi:chromate transporter